MRLRWLVLLSASAGCGVLSGLDQLSVEDGGAADVITSSDAAAEGASDAGIDVTFDVGACESGACGAPAGFQPVLFAADRLTLCPTGTTTLDVVVDPSAPSNACSCNCNYQPSCLPQPFSYTYGLTTCSSQGTLSGQVDGGCNGVNVSLLGGHLAAGPLPPSNACTNAPKTNGNASTPPGRVCTVADCSSCATVSGFAMCYAQTGAVTCPQGMTKHVVGSAAQLTCGACTACTSTAKCKGTLQMYSDGQCATPTGSLTVDGTCQAFNSNNIQSVKYVPNLDPGTCTPGASTATIAVSAQTTVCCP